MRLISTALVGLVAWSAAGLGVCRHSAAPQETASTSPGLAWFVLHSIPGGKARFVTIDRNGDTVAVDATSSNLETATLTDVRRGRIPQSFASRLFEALHRTEWDSLRNPPLDEPIEERRPLLDLAVDSAGLTVRRAHLDLGTLPKLLSESIERALSASEQLARAPEGGVLQAVPVDARRSARIRSDPRKTYTIRSLDKTDLAASPGVDLARKYPGAVVVVSKAAMGRLAAWREASNPQRLGDTFFVEIAGDAGKNDLQIHLKLWPPG